MFNCIAGILGSKSCKTDLSLSNSSAKSIWNTASFPGSPRREEEGEIAIWKGHLSALRQVQNLDTKGTKKFQV